MRSNKNGDDQKAVLSIERLAATLAEGLEGIESFVEGLKKTGDDIEPVEGELNRELTMAYLFALTHSLEIVFCDHLKLTEILKELHRKAYTYLQSEYIYFNGPGYEDDLGQRYFEYRMIMSTQSPSDALMALGESISRRLWAEGWRNKVGYVVAIGVWLGGTIGATKEFLSKKMLKYNIR